MTANVAVIILTYNEEANIAQALASVAGWARQVFVVDSYSTDKTISIASDHPCFIVKNSFESYCEQRNFALSYPAIDAEWILFLDADEWLPNNLKREITQVIAKIPIENGFYINRRLIWGGKWIRRGYYPVWILRLVRHGKARCENRPVNEHLIVEGTVGYLQHDFIHEDRKGITSWIAKHNYYAEREAFELFRADKQKPNELEAQLWGTQAQRKRWIRHFIWNHLPPLVRPFLYFFYRYVITGAFCEGRPAFIYHFLHALWFPMLIDVKYIEMKRQVSR